MGLTLEPPRLPPVTTTSGLDADAVRALVASGEFRKVRRGALTPAPDDDGGGWQERSQEALARIVAVQRKLTNGAVVSHSSAALLHGLWLYRLPTVVHVIQRSKPNGHSARDIRRHCPKLPPQHVTTVNGVRTTTIERTIVDCARTMHPRDAVVVADAGMRALVRPDRFDRATSEARAAALRATLVEMVGRGPGHGRRRARAVIAMASPYAESPPESVVRWIAVAAGLPAPTVQLPVHTRGGTFYADLGWEWVDRSSDGPVRVVRRVLSEYDGELKYLAGGGLVADAVESSAAVVAEKRREDLIREDPVTVVLRLVRADLRNPRAVVERLLTVMPPEVRELLTPVPDLVTEPASPLV